MASQLETAVLTYWDGRGNAEIVRLVLAACGQPWVEKVYGSDAEHLSSTNEITTMMDAGVLGFDQVPLLQIDGLHIVQKQAIVRHLARKHNMYGSDAAEATQCDVLSEGCRDFIGRLKYNDFGDSFHNALKVFMPRFERALRSNPTHSGFYVGSSVTFVDIQLFEVLYWGRENSLNYADLGWPLVEANVTLVAQLPGVAAYLKSPRRFPFPGRDGYMGRVKAVMPWLFGEGSKPDMSSPVWHFKAT